MLAEPMRFRPLVALSLVAPLILAITPLGCSDLDDLELGSCGNNVDDPAEDCDGYDAGPDTHCNLPGHAAECRYSCAPDEEGGRYVCPPGFGCGRDLVCRAASGAFGTALTLDAPAGRWLHLDDFDGDGRADLASLHGPTVDVQFFGAAGRPEGRYQVLASLPRPNRPLAGDLSDDGLSDLVLPGEFALSVLVADSDRSFRPKTYLAIDLPSVARIVSPDIIPDFFDDGETGSHAGNEGLLLTELDGVDVFLDARNPLLTTVVAPAPGAASQLVSAPVVAQLVEDDPTTPDLIESPGEELALAYEGQDNVYLYAPSYVVDPNAPEGVALVLEDPKELALASADELGSIVRLVAVQLNAQHPSFSDNHVDLLIATDAGAVYQAFGTGRGTFHSQQELPPAGTEDMTAARYDAFEGCVFLAAADLDGDGLVDLVLPDGIWLSSDQGTCLKPSLKRPGGRAWTTAIIADLNANGWLDVVAASRTGGGVDFFNGTGTTSFTHASISTTGKTGELAIGDFDGDLTTDVVFSQLGAEADGRDGLMVAFGRPGGLPEPPRAIGSLFAIDGIYPHDTRVEDDVFVDAATDLLVIADKTDQPSAGSGLAALSGRSDRQLQTPFVMVFPADADVGPRFYLPGASSVGTFWSADGLPRAGIISYGVSLSPLAPPPLNSFVGIRASGDAELQITSEPADPMLGAVESLRGTLVAVDVDGDDVVEPISLTWLNGAPPYQVTVAVIGRDAEAWLPRGQVTLPDLTLVGFDSGSKEHVGDGDLPFLMEWLPDMHGPPFPCVLTAKDGLGGAELLVPAVRWQSGKPSELVVIVLWNHILQSVAAGQGGAFSPGGNRVGEIGVIRAPAGEWLAGVTCLNADGDGQMELALVTIAKRVSGPGAEPAAEIHLYTLDLPAPRPADQPASLKLILRLDEDELEGLKAAGDERPPVAGLVAGDIDGDGIDDLAIGAGTNLATLLGLEGHP